MIGVTPCFDVMISDLTLSVRVTPAVLLMNFISAAAVLLLSDFFSAQVSHPYVIIYKRVIHLQCSFLLQLILLKVLLISMVTLRNFAILLPTSTSS